MRRATAALSGVAVRWMQPAGPYRGPTESLSTCSHRKAVPKQKPRRSSVLGPRQPGMAGRGSWAWDAGQRLQGLPSTVQAQPINPDRRQQGCADPSGLRATQHSREGSVAAATPRGAAGTARGAQNAPFSAWRSSSPSPLQHRASNKSHCLQSRSSSLCPAAGFSTATPPPHSSLSAPLPLPAERKLKA